MKGKNEDKKVNCLLSKDINKCPAVILAINRTDKVIGRISLLIVSIITINIINMNGVPDGTRWENIFFEFLTQP